MAKDKQQILRTVRLGQVNYKPGQEEELAEAFSKEKDGANTIQSLTDRGVIAGFGGTTSSKTEPAVEGKSASTTKAAQNDKK